MKQTSSAMGRLKQRLDELDEQGLLRRRPAPVATVAKSFCSNDYLGLASALVVSAPAGAGASRLIVGERPQHIELERELSAWLGLESVLAFASGYAANLGVVSALAESGDLIVSDELNHASLVDGCRLSRARVHVVPHLDLNAIEAALKLPRQGNAWVLTESYFSMDADSPDLARLRELCDERDAALVVDEAHALGLFGPAGRGLCAEAGMKPDVLVGTLGKAFGSAGAFVGGADEVIDWLWNRARSFVFSTGASPATMQAALTALPVVRDDSERRGRLHENAEQLRRGLLAMGIHCGGYGPIIPILVGASERAMRAASTLRDAGVYVSAVRPPTVPVGTSRLRVTVTAAHTPNDIELALGAFEKARPWLVRSS